MHLLYFNDFLAALTLGLLNSLWQVGLLWIIYQFITNTLKTSSSVKFKILTCLQVTAFSWFIATIIKYYNTENVSSILNFWGQNHLFQNSLLSSTLQLFAVLYLFFIVVKAIKLFFQITQTHKQTNNFELYTSEHWNKFAKQVSNQLSITKKIILKTTTENLVPYTIGIIKPIIVIPVAAINNLTAQQLEAIIIHEIAHIKRQDYITNILLLIIDAVMFFNPFVKLINKELDIERELCCDDMVIDYPFATSQYAQALLNIAKTQITDTSYSGALGVIASNKQLKYRINRMFNRNSNQQNSLASKSYFAFGVLFAIAIFGLVGFIDFNIKSIVSNATANTFQQQATYTPVVFKNSNNSIQTHIKSSATLVKSVAKEVESKETKEKFKAISNLNEDNSNTIALEEKKFYLEEGLKNLANEIAKQDKSLVSLNDANTISDSLNNNKIEIIPAIQQTSNIIVERFLIPATSQSAASIILVTTTIKEDGTKQVKIEIEKGKGSIE